MRIFVAEINGRGFAAVNAERIADAEAVLDSSAFEAELMVLESGGAPLWDGKAQIRVREALPEEEAAWRQSRTEAVRADDMDDEREIWLSFLVPVVDPTDPAEILAQRAFHY